MNALALRRFAGFISILCCVVYQPAHSQAVAEAAPTATANDSAHTKDPFEKFNRALFEFNDTIDRTVLKPIAQGYQTVVPEPARNCVSNIFSNVSDVAIAANNLLQGKPLNAIADVCRVLINSTVGLLGCFDVASEIGLVKHNEDFGQTLGRWGLGAGPYLVLPFFGPSTLRDSAGLAVDAQVDPVASIHPIDTRNQVLVARLVQRREALLDVGDLLEKVALDRYAYVRDAYLQRRRSQVYDGIPPEDEAATLPQDSVAHASEKTLLAMQASSDQSASGVAIPLGWFVAPIQR